MLFRSYEDKNYSKDKAKERDYGCENIGYHLSNFFISSTLFLWRSSLLASVGINTFFTGTDAGDMNVNADIVATPGLLATSLGPGMDDNENVKLMAAVKDQAVVGLNSLTCGEFYRRMSTGIGQMVSLKRISMNNSEAIMLTLQNQQSETSGVDINDEAAQLLLYQQMFQAMAKYMSTLNASIASLMQIL